MSGTWGCRFLTVSYRPLIAKVWDARGFVELRAGTIEVNAKTLAAIESISLRQRVLRFANLAGSELFGADLFGVQLQHAILQDVKLKGANLHFAWLEGADLRAAQLQGADLRSAQMQGADLRSAQLQGADLTLAQMQGADLQFVQLQGADLIAAGLQGADLGSAQLQGADLQFAHAEAANLRSAQLHGADLKYTQLQGADLRLSALWNIRADSTTQISLGDLRGVNCTVPDEKSYTVMLTTLPETVKKRIKAVLTPRVDADMLPMLGTRFGTVLLSVSADTQCVIIDRARITTDPALHGKSLADFLVVEATHFPFVAESIALRTGLLKRLGASIDEIIAYMRQQNLDEIWRRELPGLTDSGEEQRGKDLACRLLAGEAAKRIVLKPNTIMALRKAEPCPP